MRNRTPCSLNKMTILHQTAMRSIMINILLNRLQNNHIHWQCKLKTEFDDKTHAATPFYRDKCTKHAHTAFQ